MDNNSDPRLSYVLSCLDAWNLLDSGRLTYSSNTDDWAPSVRILIVDSGFFGSCYGTSASLPGLPLAEVNQVPLLFGKPCIERRGDTLIVHADIIASAYFLLTRYEEWVRPSVRDEHGRFPGRESLPYRAGFIDRPIVQEYAALLRKWAREQGIYPPEEKRTFSVLLTHDVDVINVPRGPIQTARSLGSAVLGRRGLLAALRAAGASLAVCQDPLDNLDDVIRLDAALTAGRADTYESVYFFMAGGQSALDGHYDIHSPRARRWLDGVKAAGAQIGLHASYDAGIHPELLFGERETLESISGVSITGNRHHFLGWREPEHGHLLRAAGITWDSTLGYADVAGFRLGTCRPVPLFCPVRQIPLGIEEHPLIVMDVTLSNRNYMGLSETDAFEYTQKLIEHTRAHNGEFVSLWHNTSLVGAPSYHRSLYKKLIYFLRDMLPTQERAGKSCVVSKQTNCRHQPLSLTTR